MYKEKSWISTKSTKEIKIINNIILPQYDHILGQSYGYQILPGTDDCNINQNFYKIRKNTEWSILCSRISVFNRIKKFIIRNETQNNIDITAILYQQQPQYNTNNVVRHLLQSVEYLFKCMKKYLLQNMRNILYLFQCSAIFIVVYGGIFVEQIFVETYNGIALRVYDGIGIYVVICGGIVVVYAGIFIAVSDGILIAVYGGIFVVKYTYGAIVVVSVGIFIAVSDGILILQYMEGIFFRFLSQYIVNVYCSGLKKYLLHFTEDMFMSNWMLYVLCRDDTTCLIERTLLDCTFEKQLKTMKNK
eukprot:88945_1